MGWYVEVVKVIKNEAFLVAAGCMLDEARHSIDIATYKFELSQRIDARGVMYLVEGLYEKVTRGISIRVLLNKTGKRSGLSRLNSRTARVLAGKGIEVKALPDNRCQHAKLILVDRCMGIIGSHNWTPRATVENFEVSVELRHAGYLEDVQAYFDKVWEKGITF